MSQAHEIPAHEPALIRRLSGGWLAVSPVDARLRIGVTAPTEEEARAAFRVELSRWFEILS